MVIWGSDTGVRVTVNFLNLRQPKFAASNVRIDETEKTQLANPPAYASFITRDLPGQMTFLSLFAIGKSYNIEKKYSEAARMIEKGVASLASGSKAPEGLPDAYFLLGRLYHEASIHDPEKAIYWYGHAAGLPGIYQSGAYTNRGTIYQDLGKLEDALADYDRAIQIDATNAIAHYNRANLLSEMGNLKGAIDSYTRAIELKPVNYVCMVCAYINRANARIESGDIAKVADEYEELVRLSPQDPMVYESRGYFRAQQGDHAGAMEDYAHAIALNPKNANSYSNRAIAREQNGDTTGALEDYNRAIEIDPTDSYSYNNRGLLKFSMDDMDGALKDLDKSIELDDKNSEAYVNLASIYAYKADLDTALSNLDKAIEANPRMAEAFIGRGAIYFSKNEPQKAIDNLSQAIAIKPDSAMAYYNRGSVYAMSGDYAQSVEDYTAALNAILNAGRSNTTLLHGTKTSGSLAIGSPDLPTVYLSRAESYESLGNFAAALSDLRSCLEHNPPERSYVESKLKELEAKLNAPD